MTHDGSMARHSRTYDALAGYATRGEVPGLIALVARRGVPEIDVIGTTAADGGEPMRREPMRREPMRRDSIVRISSMTEPITAAAAMALIDDGTLTLDELVDRLLPELAGRRVLRGSTARLTTLFRRAGRSRSAIF